MAKNNKLKISQIKSPIGYKQKAKRTVEALGLKKLNQSIEHNQNESIKGMIKTIDYLIKVEEI